jgi:heterodisulfide reductase subunit C2
MTENVAPSEKKPVIIDDLNPNFKDEVAAELGGEHIKSCFACGTCSVTCPVFGVEERFDPRRIIRMIILGMEDEVLQSDLIWLCAGCYSCTELCPRDVKFTNVITAVREIAVKKGYIPLSMKGGVDQLEKFGRLLEVSEFEVKVRNKKNIPQIEADVTEIKELLKKIGTRKAIEGGESNE